jgi:hypothetical protein
MAIVIRWSRVRAPPAPLQRIFFKVADAAAVITSYAFTSLMGL